MSKLIPLLLLVTGAAAPILPAQALTAIAPKSGAPGGNTNNNIPFSWYPTRYQQIFAPDAFTKTNLIPMRSVALRMNKNFANGRYGGQTVTLSLYLSLANKSLNGVPVTPANYSSTFANNLDSTTTKLVINKKKILLPKLNNQNFGFKLPFDTGAIFVWLGLKGKRSLVLEARTYGNTSNNRPFTYPLDAWWGRSAGNGSYTQNGTYAGCLSKSGARVSHYGNTSLFKVNSPSHYFYGYGRAANLPSVIFLGSKAMSGQLPGTSCYMVQDILFLLTGVSSGASGFTRIPVPIPNNQSLAGKKLFTQMLWVQPGANKLGLTTSRGLIQTVGRGASGGTEATRLFRSGSTTGNPDNYTTAAGVTRNFGLIFFFSSV